MRVSRRKKREMRERKALKQGQSIRLAMAPSVRVHTSYSGSRGFWPLSQKRGGATPPSSRKLWTGVKAREITIANKLKG